MGGSARFDAKGREVRKSFMSEYQPRLKTSEAVVVVTRHDVGGEPQEASFEQNGQVVATRVPVSHVNGIGDGARVAYDHDPTTTELYPQNVRVVVRPAGSYNPTADNPLSTPAIFEIRSRAGIVNGTVLAHGAVIVSCIPEQQANYPVQYELEIAEDDGAGNAENVVFNTTVPGQAMGAIGGQILATLTDTATDWNVYPIVGSGFTSSWPGDYFLCQIEDEKILVRRANNLGGNIYAFIARDTTELPDPPGGRGYDGTTAVSHAANTLVKMLARPIPWNGLDPNTVYWYRVRARGPNTRLSAWTDWVGHTTEYDTTAPSWSNHPITPTWQSGPGGEYLRVDWGPVDVDAGDLWYYEVGVSADDGATFTIIKHGNGTFFQEPTQPGWRRHYKVRPVDTSLNVGLWSNTIIAVAFPTGPGANQIANPSFEDDLTGWTIDITGGNESVTRENWGAGNALHGAYVANVASSFGFSPELYYDGITVTAGDNVTFNGFVHLTEVDITTNDNSAGATLTVYDSGASVIATYPVLYELSDFIELVGGGYWAHLYWQGEMPASAATLRVTLGLYTPDAVDSVVARFDAIYLHRDTPAVPRVGESGFGGFVIGSQASWKPGATARALRTNDAGEATFTLTEVKDGRSAGNISAAAATLTDRLSLLEMDTYNVQANGVLPANTAAANTTALNALIASNRRIVIPEGTYDVLVYDDGGASVEGITIAGVENLHLLLHPGAVLRAAPTAQGVTPYHILKLGTGANNIVIEGGTFQGDRDTHLLTASAHTDTLTAALSGGENTLPINDTTGWDTGTRNLIVEDNSGVRHHTVFTVTDGTNLALQTPVPVGFTADAGNSVYHTIGENGINIRIDGAENVTLLDVRSIDAWTDGFYITNTASKHINMYNCYSDNNRRQGMSIVGGSVIRVFGGYFLNTLGAQPGYGIDIEPSGAYTISDVELHGVTCTGNARHGLGIHGQLGDANGRIWDVKVFGGLFAENVRDGVFIYRTSGHLFDGVTSRNNSDNGFQILADGTTAGANILNADRHQFIGCVARDNDEAGWLFDADGDATIDSIRIIGGEGRANSGVGIEMDASGATGDGILSPVVDGTLVTANTSQGIVATDVWGGEFAPHATANGTNGVHIIEGGRNHIGGYIERNNEVGVVLADSASNTVSARIEGNSQTTDATYDGVLVWAPTATCNNNRIRLATIYRGSGAKQQRYAVRVFGANCNNTIIEENDLTDGGKTAIYNNSGTGTFIRRNRGYATEGFGLTSFTPDGSGNGNIAHGLVGQPTFINLNLLGDNANEAVVENADATNIIVRIRNTTTNADVTTGTQFVYWEARR